MQRRKRLRLDYEAAAENDSHSRRNKEDSCQQTGASNVLHISWSRRSTHKTMQENAKHGTAMQSGRSDSKAKRGARAETYRPRVP